MCPISVRACAQSTQPIWQHSILNKNVFYKWIYKLQDILIWNKRCRILRRSAQFNVNFGWSWSAESSCEYCPMSRLPWWCVPVMIMMLDPRSLWPRHIYVRRSAACSCPATDAQPLVDVMGPRVNAWLTTVLWRHTSLRMCPRHTWLRPCPHGAGTGR